jgi:hypothetical protein
VGFFNSGGLGGFDYRGGRKFAVRMYSARQSNIIVVRFNARRTTKIKIRDLYFSASRKNKYQT